RADAVLRGGRDLRLDCAALERLDSLGLAFLTTLNREAGAAGRRLVLARLRPQPAAALDAVPADALPDGGPARENFFESLGGAALALAREWKTVGLLLSECVYHSTLGWRRPKTLLHGETATQMIRLGSTALPIVL